MEQRFFTSHSGLVSDYLSEALRELRRMSLSDAVTREFGLGSHLNARDEKAVRKTVSGFLKLSTPTSAGPPTSASIWSSRWRVGGVSKSSSRS